MFLLLLSCYQPVWVCCGPFEVCNPQKEYCLNTLQAYHAYNRGPHSWGRAAESITFEDWPGVTEEICALSISSPHQPLSEGRVAEHARFVSPFDEKAGEQLHALLEVLPLQLPSDVPRVDGLKQLLISHGVQRRKSDVQDRQRALEGRVGHELHVALQLVKFSQWHRHYFVAGTFNYKVALLKEIQGEFEIQVGTLAAGDQVAAELGYSAGIRFAIKADVVHYILAAIDPVLDVAIEVIGDLFVVRKIIQWDFREG